MSCRLRTIAFALLFLTTCALAQSPDSTATTLSPTHDSTVVTATTTGGSVLQWIEQHGVLFGGLVFLTTAFIGVWAGWWMARRSERRIPIVTERTKRAEKKIEREIQREIQFETNDEILKRYLQGVQNEHDTIKLYGFQSRVNLDVRTLEVFVSLRLTEEWRDDRRMEMLAMELERELTPKKVLQRALAKNRLLLIIGDPGSGKTTLLKYYAMSCLDQAGRQALGLTKALIPILLPLRKADPKQPFGAALSAWATWRSRPVSAELFDTWLHQHGALVMLDGLDEISDVSKRKQVCEWIDNAADYFPNSQFVVTSRYTGYRVAEGIELHTDHLRADVLDLDADQQRIFLQKWFGAVYGRQLEDEDLTEAERRQEATAQGEELAAAVLKYLNREENASLRRMAGMPVLLQIMAILWREYHNLPPARAALYEKCLDYLLDYRDRDRDKDIIPLLPADDAKIVLRPLCLWMQEHNQSDEISSSEIEQRVAQRLEEVKPGVAPRAFIENLRDRAGVLQDFGEGDYVFRHKSFREYLAATQLAEEVQRQPARVQVLVDNFDQGWWRETLLFSLSLPKPVIFSDFFARLLPHEHNTAGFPTLLQQVIKEARHKPVDAFESFVIDPEHDWRQRYNALLCLRLIASEPAKALVQRVWEQELQEMRLKQKAEEILIEWKMRRPALEAAAIVRGVSEQFRSWRNPVELDAEYILIPGGKYVYSVTEKEVEVAPLYFAKYPVTNKLYRRFIDYLGEKKGQELFEELSREIFAKSLLADAKEIAGFEKYLGRNSNRWASKLRSAYDDDKRFNGDDQPVVGVSWFAAVAYCHWLSELYGLSGRKGEGEKGSRGDRERMLFRLPQEEEWEWAASGGTRKYPWGDEQPDETRANYHRKVGNTTPVGAYPNGATPEGLLDMAGNVWERQENLYGKDLAARALRGGSWFFYDDDLQCRSRFRYDPDFRYDFVGFRVVLSESLFFI